LPAGRTGDFGFEFKSAFETFLAGGGIINQSVIDFGHIFQAAEVEIHVAAVAGE